MMKLTPAQLQQYKDEGYTVVRGLISAEEASRVRNRLMELLDGNHDWPVGHLHVLDPAKYRAPNGKFLPVGVQRPSTREKVFRDVAYHPRLQAVMEQLLGGPVKLFTDQALIKNSKIDGQSFYHQDSYYWHIKPELGCNSWIALDEVGKGAIALAILPGTHRTWTLTPHEEYFDEPTFHNDYNGRAFKRYRIPLNRVDFSKEVLLPMKPGDAAFFTNFTWHRAESNQSGAHKCAYAVAYQLRDAHSEGAASN